MPYRINTGKKIYIQYTLFDFIEKSPVEDVDCRTVAGRRRYRDLFGRTTPARGTRLRASKNCITPSLDQFLAWSRDIEYLFERFNERDRRLFAGFMSIAIGCGDVQEAAGLTGLDPKTVRRGQSEILTREKMQGDRVRAQGGGRPSKEDSEPRYLEEIRVIMDDDVAGDPMGHLKWTRKTLNGIRNELNEKGIDAVESTIRRTFKRENISLKKNVKSKNTRDHPDRDKQFQHLNNVKTDFLARSIPVISVDAKKKELIGNFKNDGSTWRKTAYHVLDHDFPSLSMGKLIPFGVYDLKENEGHVYCGTSRETSEFAVDSIVLWWQEFGQGLYPGQDELLILCDSGGANGYLRRAWKWELQAKLADQFGLTVHVCHYPSGASKYNPVERRLFSYISIHWAGEPLTSYEKAIGFIESTTTGEGLTVTARLINKEYQKGIKISDEQMASLQIERHDICPKWNYIIHPRRFDLKAAGRSPVAGESDI
jgi:transposase